MSAPTTPQPAAPVRRGGSPARALLALGLLPIVCMVLFVLGLGFLSTEEDLAILGVALLTGALSLVSLALDQGRPPERRQLLISIMGISFFVFFVAPVFSQYFLFEGYTEGVQRLVNIAPGDILNGQLAALLGLACMLLGYALPLGGLVAQALPQPTREWSLPASLGVVTFMMPLAWVIFLLSQFGLMPSRLGTGIVGAVGAWYFYGIALLTVVYLRYRSPAALLLMAAFIPPTMGLAFFTGSKTALLAPLAMVALTHIVVTRSIRLSWILGGLALIVVIYPVAQFYREFVQAGNRLSFVQVLKDPVGTLSLITAFLGTFHPWEYLRAGFEATGHRLNGLGILSLIVRDTPDRVPYQGGWTMSYVLIAYIPRVLWAGKPITNIGQWVTDNYTAVPGVVQSNTGPSWIGELYFNFGLPGVVAGMTFFGIYFRFLQSYLFRPNATIPALFIGVVVLFSTARTLGGGLIAPINSVSFQVMPLVLIHLVVRGLTRPGPAPGTLPPPRARGVAVRAEPG